MIDDGCVIHVGGYAARVRRALLNISRFGQGSYAWGCTLGTTCCQPYSNFNVRSRVRRGTGVLFGWSSIACRSCGAYRE
jgi:hypothetical protein